MFNFLYSRVVRIYPAYLATAFIFIVSLILLPDKNPNLTEILNTICFNFGKSGGYVYVGWTLFYEMIFYLIFSLIIKNFNSIAKNDFFIYFISILLIFSYLTSLNYITDFIVGITIFLIKNFSSNQKNKKLNIISLLLNMFINFYLRYKY